MYSTVAGFLFSPHPSLSNLDSLSHILLINSCVSSLNNWILLTLLSGPGAQTCIVISIVASGGNSFKKRGGLKTPPPRGEEMESQKNRRKENESQINTAAGGGGG